MPSNSLAPLAAIVPAGGSGMRFGAPMPKQYCMLNGRTVIEQTLAVLLAYAPIEMIFVGIGAADKHWASLAVSQHARVERVVAGQTRMQTVHNCLDAAQDRFDWVLVHDAVRPCVRPADIDKLCTSITQDEAGSFLAMPLSDTLKRVDQRGLVTATLERAGLWQAQTPQLFAAKTLLQGLQQGARLELELPDDAAAVELLGLPLRPIEGHSDNIKITHRCDLALAEAILKYR